MSLPESKFIVSKVGQAYPEGGYPDAEPSRSEIQVADFGVQDWANGGSKPIVPSEEKALRSLTLCWLTELCALLVSRTEMPIAPANLLKLARKPRHVNHLQAIIGADSTHDSVNVVFYGLLGEIQARCNLFIRQALRDHGNNLLLSAGQAEFDSKTRTGDRRPLPGKRMEQVHAKFRGADGLPLGCRLNAGHDFRCGSIF